MDHIFAIILGIILLIIFLIHYTELKNTDEQFLYGAVLPRWASRRSYYWSNNYYPYRLPYNRYGYPRYYTPFYQLY